MYDAKNMQIILWKYIHDKGHICCCLTYNSAELIEDHLVRLVSECNQFEEIEIIVKDGCSIDNTLEKLEKFQNDVLIVSDTGIYDALNQATALIK